MSGYVHYDSKNIPIKAWVKGVPFDHNALQQLRNVAEMPFAHHHVTALPDVHLGIGATVGSVVATKGAIIPAAVGVDIGCGMMAVRLDANASHLPDNLSQIRSEIERSIPVGMASHKSVSRFANERMNALILRLGDILHKHPGIEKKGRDGMGGVAAAQMGTLGGGNHFIEICLDEEGELWIMLHSGSRGIGNKIGQYFIALAKEDMRTHFINLPDKDLAYFPEGTENFGDYFTAVSWAQQYALSNRDTMMDIILDQLRRMSDKGHFPEFKVTKMAVNCHHNYVNRENHFGANVLVTRKGAVSAQQGQLGIIPGSMGARSYIVEGLGNPDSFHSCSHGAGRVLSRGEAKRQITVEDHIEATKGVECRKDEGVLDESPASYKDIDAVMAAQSDLVRPIHTLKQILCVKG